MLRGTLRQVTTTLSLLPLAVRTILQALALCGTVDHPHKRY
jgi:hypothetical protein